MPAGGLTSSTDAWLTQRGLQQGKIPREMRLRSH
jgi:hypothetical protein